MKFSPNVDIHCHLLYASDDGAADPDTMKKMLDAAYNDGTRVLCVTPHFCPHLFGNNTAAACKALEELEAYAKGKYRDNIFIFSGNELRYFSGAVDALKKGQCLSLARSRFVLVDFDTEASMFEINAGLSELLSSGFVPVLAHAERYRHMSIKDAEGLLRQSVIISADSGSISGDFGLLAKIMVKKMLKKNLVHLIASDSHNLSSRPPVLSHAKNYIQRHYGEDRANRLFSINPLKILKNELNF